MSSSFVSSDSCAPGAKGNALTRLADGLTRDRSHGAGAGAGQQQQGFPHAVEGRAGQRRWEREQAVLRGDGMAPGVPQQLHHSQPVSTLGGGGGLGEMEDVFAMQNMRLVDDFQSNFAPPQQQQQLDPRVPADLQQAFLSSSQGQMPTQYAERHVPDSSYRQHQQQQQSAKSAGGRAAFSQSAGMMMYPGARPMMDRWGAASPGMMMPQREQRVMELSREEEAKYLKPAPQLEPETDGQDLGVHGPKPVEQWVNEFSSAKEDTTDADELRRLARNVASIDDPKFQQSQFRDLMSKVGSGEISFNQDGMVQSPAVGSTKAEVDDDIFNRDITDAEGYVDPEKWAQEFEARARAAGERWAGELGQDAELGEEWMQEYKRSMNEWAALNDLDGVQQTQVDDYEFVADQQNPYISHDDPFAKGVQLFAEGRIHQAILAFEAALKLNPKHAECWRRLGQAHAENDKDGRAIAALNRSLKVATENGDGEDPETLMLLTVSYTNDLYRENALEELVRWLGASGVPEYAALVSPVYQNKQRGGMFSGAQPFDAHHQAVADMFIRAARLRPTNPDPDVQTALGLLFNISQEYEKAVDCFQAALNVRPADYMLWNKLGATLANSNRSEEALGCYQKALAGRPTFVRARANLGISFMALRDYEKAATYFLGALSMHPEARHLWNHLQMVLMSMGRNDLVEKSLAGNVEDFRNDFTF